MVLSMANLDEPVSAMPRPANFRIRSYIRTETPFGHLTRVKVNQSCNFGTRTLYSIVGKLLEMARFSLFEIIKSSGNRCDKKLRNGN